MNFDMYKLECLLLDYPNMLKSVKPNIKASSRQVLVIGSSKGIKRKSKGNFR